MSAYAHYDRKLVFIHWLSAFLIIFMLFFGMLVLKRLPSDESKLIPLAIHMIIGLTILMITLIRILVRNMTPKPIPATTGNRMLDIIGVAVHYLLYLGAIGMGISGIGIAVQARLFQSVFERVGPLPQNFYIYPPRIGHGYFALALLALIGLHIAAALYHQIILKDRLLSRMWFGHKG